MNTLFPPLTRAYILSFQFSAWYPLFSAQSIKSTVIRPLSAEFRAYMDADGVFVPAGADDAPVESTLKEVGPPNSDDEDDGDDGGGTRRHYAFPELDAQIRACVQAYGAVFPKLNFTSPQDAAWLLPASSPLKCTSPADVYLLLKSSDFVNHDLSSALVFEGCAKADDEPDTSTSPPEYELELVLRKWYPIDKSRELRCFVREGVFLGISQRDTNFYAFWNDPATQARVIEAVCTFWETHIVPKTTTKDYVFDLLLTRDLSRGHIVDFNPYAPKTDPLLFSYAELQVLLLGSRGDSTTAVSTAPTLPMLRVIDSASHPAATSAAPAHQHNMIPFEAVRLSSGRDIEDFADTWKASVKESMQDGSDDDTAQN